MNQPELHKQHGWVSQTMFRVRTHMQKMSLHDSMYLKIWGGRDPLLGISDRGEYIKGSFWVTNNISWSGSWIFTLQNIIKLYTSDLLTFPYACYTLIVWSNAHPSLCTTWKTDTEIFLKMIPSFKDNQEEIKEEVLISRCSSTHLQAQW